MKKRYKVVDKSVSAHCCFVATVVDTKNNNENICEFFSKEDAVKVCEALNKIELVPPKSGTDKEKL